LGNEYGTTAAVLTAAPYFRDDIKYHPVINPDPGALRKWALLREMAPKRMHHLRHMWHELRADRQGEPATASSAAAPHREVVPTVPHKREK
jgi:putative spermidine/putrescine transport system substrate-binding protein/spermidine/putrescine transport system substrate-binding protein